MQNSNIKIKSLNSKLNQIEPEKQNLHPKNKSKHSKEDKELQQFLKQNNKLARQYNLNNKLFTEQAKPVSKSLEKCSYLQSNYNNNYNNQYNKYLSYQENDKQKHISHNDCSPKEECNIKNSKHEEKYNKFDNRSNKAKLTTSTKIPSCNIAHKANLQLQDTESKNNTSISHIKRKINIQYEEHIKTKSDSLIFGNLRKELMIKNINNDNSYAMQNKLIDAQYLEKKKLINAQCLENKQLLEKKKLIDTQYLDAQYLEKKKLIDERYLKKKKLIDSMQMKKLKEALQKLKINNLIFNKRKLAMHWSYSEFDEYLSNFKNTQIAEKLKQYKNLTTIKLQDLNKLNLKSNTNQLLVEENFNSDEELSIEKLNSKESNIKEPNAKQLNNVKINNHLQDQSNNTKIDEISPKKTNNKELNISNSKNNDRFSDLNINTNAISDVSAFDKKPLSIKTSMQLKNSLQKNQENNIYESFYFKNIFIQYTEDFEYKNFINIANLHKVYMYKIKQININSYKDNKKQLAIAEYLPVANKSKIIIKYTENFCCLNYLNTIHKKAIIFNDVKKLISCKNYLFLNKQSFQNEEIDIFNYVSKKITKQYKKYLIQTETIPIELISKILFYDTNIDVNIHDAILNENFFDNLVVLKIMGSL